MYSHSNPPSASLPYLYLIPSRLDATPELIFLGTTEKDTWTTRSEIFRPTDLSTTVYSRSTTVDLTQDYGFALKLAVSEFIPLEGDETSYIWTIDGATVELKMPCYAITNMQKSKLTLENYMEMNLHKYIEDFTGSSSQIVYDTFQIALAKAHKVRDAGD